MKRRTKSKVFFSFLICIGWSIVLLSSCDRGTSNGASLGEKMDMNSVESIELNLDSSTGFHQRYLRYQKLNGEYRLSILNKITNSIQVYDLETGELEWSLRLEIEGPNGVGKNPSAYILENYDSLYVFDGQTGRVTLLDGEGKAMNRYHLMQAKTNAGVPFPIVEKASPLLKVDGEIYSSGIIPGGWRGIELNEEPMLKLDLQNDSLTFWLKRPSLNTEKNWGNDLMNYIFYDFNRVDKSFIIGFANYENIIVVDEYGNTKEYNTPSFYFDKPFPLSNDFDKAPSEKRLREYYSTVPRYWGVFYDPYRGLIYRLARIPYEDKVMQRQMKMKTSIIVMSSNMEKLGEAMIDDEVYDPSMIFVGQKGLYIASKKRFNEDEDLLVFDLIEFREK